jgi:hypothetical protein
MILSPLRRYSGIDPADSGAWCPGKTREEAMATLHRMPIMTLGWQSWAVVAVVLTLVLLSAMLFVG